MIDNDKITEKFLDHELQLNNHEHQIKDLCNRMDKSEEQQKSINSLAQSVNELAINMRYMFEEQRRQGERLFKLEQSPVEDFKYYRKLIVGCLITGILGAILTAIMTLIQIK